MSHKSGMERAADAAYHADSVRRILQKLLTGGWEAAALEAVKRYWPQILGISLAMLIFPLLIIYGLPMTVFGFASSDDPQVRYVTDSAQTAAGLFDRCDELFDEVTDAVLLECRQNGAGISGGIIGEPIPENTRIALYTVSVGNDPTQVTEEGFRTFLRKCLAIDLVTLSNNTQAVTVRYRTEQEIMDACGFSDFDRQWVALLQQQEENDNG